jgi:hypothetical protein
MKTRLALLSLLVLCLGLAFSAPQAQSQPYVEHPECVESGGIDDTLYATHCCSGQAVPGSTYCIDPADWYTDWASCSHICA